MRSGRSYREYEVPLEPAPPLHADLGAHAPSLLDLLYHVAVGYGAVDRRAVLAQPLTVDPRGGHLRVGEYMGPVPQRFDPNGRGVLLEHQIVGVIEIGRGMYASLDYGELRLRPGASVKLRCDDLHVPGLDLLRP